MDEPSAVALLECYLSFLRPGGRVFFVCPQEMGYSTGATHIRFVDGSGLMDLPPGGWNRALVQLSVAASRRQSVHVQRVLRARAQTGAR